MTDLRVAADKMKILVLGGTEEQSAATARPWNLRTRRAACKAPPSPKEEKEKSENSGSAASKMKEKRERPKFSVSLLREEIEEDFAAMVGTRPPRRPKKRPRYVQKELDVSSFSVSIFNSVFYFALESDWRSSTIGTLVLNFIFLRKCSIERSRIAFAS